MVVYLTGAICLLTSFHSRVSALTLVTSQSIPCHHFRARLVLYNLIGACHTNCINHPSYIVGSMLVVLQRAPIFSPCQQRHQLNTRGW
ncbi:hypothetical protein B0T22DRAFT_447916 [Podospora appendiculata]|uniref:Secreted protein n=1 Tax=Podospora appendiculata TaxID=314037 RepID=A0AAE0XG90_9PEZI|nr:hypothetical protein B0T22DRAFT_447916 [Podospora appendiculata]